MKAFKSVLEFAAKEQTIPDSQKEWLRWKEQNNTTSSDNKNVEDVDAQPTNKRSRPSEARDSTSNWKQLVEPKTGKVYYFNQVTGESVDEKPKEYIVASNDDDDESSSSSSSEQEQQEQQQDGVQESKGKEAPHMNKPQLAPQIWEKKTNSLTRKSEWYCPELDYVLDKLPPEHPWRGVKLPDGRVYFWNTKTDETKWI